MFSRLSDDLYFSSNIFWSPSISIFIVLYTRGKYDMLIKWNRICQLINILIIRRIIYQTISFKLFIIIININIKRSFIYPSRTGIKEGREVMNVEHKGYLQYMKQKMNNQIKTA